MKSHRLIGLAVAAAAILAAANGEHTLPTPKPTSAAVSSQLLRAADQWTNDPYSKFEWELPATFTDYIDTGQPMYQEVHPIGVDALDAWQQTTGGGVIVAVVDTGFDVNAADMQGQWWVNPGEISSNGIDDDHNGIVDDVNGANFRSRIGDVSGTDPHGEEVASVLAAQANNGVGIAGIAPGARLMALRTGDASGLTSITAASAAIEYAVSHGAKVINLSWGSLGADCSPWLQQAFTDADRHGVLIVAAAGNDSKNIDGMSWCPDLHTPNEVMVAATDETNQVAGFSNYGPTSVDLAAPGADIPVLEPTSRWGYAIFSGTSFSAPIVSAVAAMAYAVRPDATAEMVKKALIDGSTPVAALKDKVISGGVVNAPNTLRLIEAAPAEGLAKRAAKPSPSAPSTSTGTSTTGPSQFSPARVFFLKHPMLVHFRWRLKDKQRYVLLVDEKIVAHVAATSRGFSLHLAAGRHFWLLVPARR